MKEGRQVTITSVYLGNNGGNTEEIADVNNANLPLF
jgi:hypothetical protein